MKDNHMKDWLELTKKNAAESFWRDVFNEGRHPFSQHSPLHGDRSNSTTEPSQNHFPRCDMYEKDNKIIIEAELPGHSPEDFTVMLKGQDLTITGKYKTLKQQLRYYLKEREDRSFVKSIIIPVKVNKAEIESYLEDGLLTIIFPMIEEKDVVPIYINFENTQSYSDESSF